MSNSGVHEPGARLPAAPVALQAALDPPRALDGKRPTGALRQRPDDFRVEEVLGFTPEGDGSHLWLLVEKRGLNTDYASRTLARVCAVAGRDVGVAGLKDRNAVVRQWFSVPVTEAARDCAARGGELAAGLTLIRSALHPRKLRRGVNRGNRFEILVRTSRCPKGEDSLSALAEQVRARGVPNYFGPQRFGRDGANLGKALAMFSASGRRPPRHLRSLFLSSARSAVFNQVLARRVRERSWDRLLSGEAVILDGRNSFFRVDDPDPELAQRLARFDIHPSGPMWGRGDLLTGGEVAALEAEVADECGALCRGLEAAGLEQERRALRLTVAHLSLDREPGLGWWLRFELPRGTYATTVLRELFELR